MYVYPLIKVELIVHNRRVGVGVKIFLAPTPQDLQIVHNHRAGGGSRYFYCRLLKIYRYFPIFLFRESSEL